MKSIRGICLLAMAILVLSCGEKRYVGTLADYPGEKEGRIRTYDEAGGLFEEGNFQDGQLHGNRKIFYPSGQLQTLETYEKGVFHGPFTKYHENGELRVKGDYVNGSMEGVWTAYYPDGRIKEEVMMEDSQENGPFTEYHPNGQKKAIGTYDHGLAEDGLLQLFDSTGTLIKKMECDSGICRTIWRLDSLENEAGR